MSETAECPRPKVDLEQLFKEAKNLQGTLDELYSQHNNWPRWKDDFIKLCTSVCGLTEAEIAVLMAQQPNGE